MNFNGLFAVEVTPIVVFVLEVDGALEMSWPFGNWCFARSSTGLRAAADSSSSSLTTSTEAEAEVKAEEEVGVFLLWRH